VTGALSLATLVELRNSNRALFNHLTGRALPLVIVAGLSGLAVIALLAAGRTRAIREIAALAVAAVVWGWGVAQYPVLLPGTALHLNNAGAPHATLVAIVALFSVVALLVGPSFALLFSLQGSLGGDAGSTLGAESRQSQRGFVTSSNRGDWLSTVGLVAAGGIVHAIFRRRNDR
jgi:cytochrome d ubiquinol oxidase subunit II